MRDRLNIDRFNKTLPFEQNGVEQTPAGGAYLIKVFDTDAESGDALINDILLVKCRTQQTATSVRRTLQRVCKSAGYCANPLSFFRLERVLDVTQYA